MFLQVCSVFTGYLNRFENPSPQSTKLHLIKTLKYHITQSPSAEVTCGSQSEGRTFSYQALFLQNQLPVWARPGLKLCFLIKNKLLSPVYRNQLSYAAVSINCCGTSRDAAILYWDLHIMCFQYIFNNNIYLGIIFLCQCSGFFL